MTVAELKVKVDEAECPVYPCFYGKCPECDLNGQPVLELIGG